jgi:hypothetical protein
MKTYSKKELTRLYKDMRLNNTRYSNLEDQLWNNNTKVFMANSVYLYMILNQYRWSMYEWSNGIQTEFPVLKNEYTNWLSIVSRWSEETQIVVNYSRTRYYSNMYLVMLMCDYEDNLESK